MIIKKRGCYKRVRPLGENGGVNGSNNFVVVKVMENESLLKSMREIAAENLGAIIQRLESIDLRLANIELRLDEIQETQEDIESRLDQIESRLDNIEEELDELT